MAVLPFIGPAIDLVSTVFKRVIPEKMSEVDAAKMGQELTLELMRQNWAPVMAQIQVNLEEAKSTRLFVAGWRPCVGWVCATALGYNFVLQPLFTFVVGVVKWQLPPTPVLDNSELMTILLGLLGLSASRTVEKVKGAVGNGQ